MLALSSSSDDFDAQVAPAGADALVVIEVADSGSTYARCIQAPLHHCAAVSAAWPSGTVAAGVAFCRPAQAPFSAR